MEQNRDHARVEALEALVKQLEKALVECCKRMEELGKRLLTRDAAGAPL